MPEQFDDPMDIRRRRPPSFSALEASVFRNPDIGDDIATASATKSDRGNPTPTTAATSESTITSSSKLGNFLAHNWITVIASCGILWISSGFMLPSSRPTLYCNTGDASEHSTVDGNTVGGQQPTITIAGETLACKPCPWSAYCKNGEFESCAFPLKKTKTACVKDSALHKIANEYTRLLEVELSDRNGQATCTKDADQSIVRQFSQREAITFLQEKLGLVSEEDVPKISNAKTREQKSEPKSRINLPAMQLIMQSTSYSEEKADIGEFYLPSTLQRSGDILTSSRTAVPLSCYFDGFLRTCVPPLFILFFVMLMIAHWHHKKTQWEAALTLLKHTIEVDTSYDPVINGNDFDQLLEKTGFREDQLNLLLRTLFEQEPTLRCDLGPNNSLIYFSKALVDQHKPATSPLKARNCDVTLC